MSAQACGTAPLFVKRSGLEQLDVLESLRTFRSKAVGILKIYDLDAVSTFHDEIVGTKVAKHVSVVEESLGGTHGLPHRRDGERKTQLAAKPGAGIFIEGHDDVVVAIFQERGDLIGTQSTKVLERAQFAFKKFFPSRSKSLSDSQPPAPVPYQLDDGSASTPTQALDDFTWNMALIQETLCGIQDRLTHLGHGSVDVTQSLSAVVGGMNDIAPLVDRETLVVQVPDALLGDEHSLIVNCWMSLQELIRLAFWGKRRSQLLQQPAALLKRPRARHPNWHLSAHARVSPSPSPRDASLQAS